MNREWISAEVLRSFRSTVLADSKREVSFDQPLGGIGFGLDSLALVEFLTAVERRFAAELPESAWTTREILTLNAIVALVEKSVGKECLSSDRAPGSGSLSPPAWRVDGQKTRFGAARPISSRIKKLTAALHRVYESKSYFVLAFDLDKAILATAAPFAFVVRIGNHADHKVLGDLYVGSQLRAKSRTFRERLLRGYVCLTAWYDGRLVGIDWIAQEVHADSMTGLEYNLRDGTCCGVDLFEHPAYQRQGIGVSLLIASLMEAKKRAFRRQVTIVDATNLRMLSATTHLLGFESIGRIRTVLVFRRPRSTWTIGKESGRTRRVLL